MNAILLLSPVTSKWHFVLWLVPAFAVAIALVRGRITRPAAALLAVLFATSALTSKGVVGRDLGIRFAEAGVFTWSAVGMAILLYTVARRTAGEAGLGAAPRPGAA